MKVQDYEGVWGIRLWRKNRFHKQAWGFPAKDKQRSGKDAFRTHDGTGENKIMEEKSILISGDDARALSISSPSCRC